jgi:hypothetical protein
MDASLPQSSALFVDHLITQLAEFKAPAHSSANDHAPRPAAHPEKQPQNVLARLPPSELARIKPLILTLHCLFPNDLLPALDILDRGLVQRLMYAETAPEAGFPAQSIEPESNQTPTTNPLHGDEAVFLVISASAEHPHPGPSSSSTPTTQDQEKGYEVRLRAWNCTCPIFVLSAFRDLELRLEPPTDPTVAVQGKRWYDRDEPVVYPFGGTLPCATDRASPPVCKHILACILFARCSGLFGGAGDGCRLVGMDEVAGWCAGWGG